jgi:hypothetical protein
METMESVKFSFVMEIIVIQQSRNDNKMDTMDKNQF